MSTLDKYQALKHNDGRMLAVVWPEAYYYEHEQDYYRAIDDAIANGIEFKEKEDILKLEYEITRSQSVPFVFEKMKPYALTEGIELEIKEIEIGHVDDYSVPHGFKKFAFIKKQQPERKEESQDELIIELIKIVSPNRWDIVDENLALAKSEFRIERIK